MLAVGAVPKQEVSWEGEEEKHFVVQVNLIEGIDCDCKDRVIQGHMIGAPQEIVDCYGRVVHVVESEVEAFAGKGLDLVDIDLVGAENPACLV